jgi:hypothetical protein
MIYGGPGFLCVILIWFLPLSCLQVASFSQSSCFSPVKLSYGGEEGGEGVERAKSYDREKAWSSINHSILSGWGNQNDRSNFMPQILMYVKKPKM